MEVIEIAVGAVTVAASVGGAWAVINYKVEQLIKDREKSEAKMEVAMERKMDLETFNTYREHQKDQCRGTHEHINRDRTELLQVMEKLSTQIESLRAVVVNWITSKENRNPS